MAEQYINVFYRMMLPPSSAREINVDMIEKMLRDKVIMWHCKLIIKMLVFVLLSCLSLNLRS